MDKQGALGKPVCPVSHGSCRLCTLYRGRHYYAFRSCKEYMQRLHDSAAPREKSTADEHETA